jgi:hypothetical protein
MFGCNQFFQFEVDVSDVRMSQVLMPESARAVCGRHGKGKGERFV